MKQTLLYFAIFFSFVGYSQAYVDQIDVQSYQVNIELSDQHDSIYVTEYINILFKEESASFTLNLASLNSGKGMIISSPITESEVVVDHTHSDDKLIIEPRPRNKGTNQVYKIEYKGIPATGLIIGKNKFGDRTFFGDNWPNRAHQWLACVDHPSDKATINFNVIAPSHYKCIATGNQISSEPIDSIRSQHTFISDKLLPTKVMVIGLADFEVKDVKSKFNFPVSIWTYPQDFKAGCTDMEVSVDVLKFFIEQIGEYPFEKLANVQSTTQFGGMENAGNIFYDENAVTGKQTMESLVAHEIAHQWFGNSASESDWKHLWLSEGFATYFTDLYWENKYGVEQMNQRLSTERSRVIQFSKKYNHPVVDTTYASLMDLLNPHSYQKGAWILHMLRHKIGDEAFWNGIKEYYSTYQYSNASTSDLKSIMAKASQMNLDTFFDQWLYRSQHPTLKINYNEGSKRVLSIYQLQNTHLFDFELEVEIRYTDGSSELKSFHVDSKREVYTLDTDKEISSFKYDPNVKLLHEIIEK